MELETERLILRDFRPDDWLPMWTYQRDPLYLRYYEWTAADRTPDAVREWVRWFVDQQQQEPRVRFQLAITLKSGGEVIGNCGIRQDRPGSHEADLGYELAPWHWGNGYATEAARAILAFGMATLRPHRVWAHCVPENIGSIHVLEKLGMRLEGRLREVEYYKGRWWDKLIFAILEHEWRATRNG